VTGKTAHEREPSKLFRLPFCPGFVAVVQRLIGGGAFGHRFPELCQDGPITCGCDLESDKKRSLKIILDATATERSLRVRLEAEPYQLNSIGNSHLICHSEVSQVPVIDVHRIEYLFHRLFAMIQLMLRKK
jgi:hypothetical protein